jgi:hypothetical protein
MGEGRGEGYGAEGHTHLGVIVFIRALLEGGQTANCPSHRRGRRLAERRAQSESHQGRRTS